MGAKFTKNRIRYWSKNKLGIIRGREALDVRRKIVQADIEAPARRLLRKIRSDSTLPIFEILEKHSKDPQFENQLIGHILYDFFPKLNEIGKTAIFEERLEFAEIDTPPEQKPTISIEVLAEGSSKWTTQRRREVRIQTQLGNMAMRIVDSIRIKPEWRKQL